MRRIHRRVGIGTVVIGLLVVVSSQCFAMMSIEMVSKERAKELGMEVRGVAAGPDAVRIELEFKTEGALKDYTRVDLEIHADGKLLLSAILREEKSSPGQIVVGFAADRAKLDKITLRVVTQSAPRDMTGYVVKVKDFIELDKIH